MALEKKVEELRTALETRYPRQTTVEYVDLRESPSEGSDEIGQLLVTRRYPSPLVVINGEPVFAGSIITNKIVREVGYILSK